MDIIKRLLLFFHSLAILGSVAWSIAFIVMLSLEGIYSFRVSFGMDSSDPVIFIIILITIAGLILPSLFVSLIRWIIEGKFYLFPNSK
jgi:hypothetical protein